ncbi:MAG TPA: NrfD/PsrC family molybdoenzyme membrane anchor subunit [Gemmatimonadaceae bacterium]
MSVETRIGRGTRTGARERAPGAVEAPSGVGATVPTRVPRVPHVRRSHRRSGGEMQLGREPAPPIKPPTWEWHIPIYIWLGGVSAGAWFAATAESMVGDDDRRTIRIARHLAMGALLGGTGLLIADLGRPERAHYMLRIVRARSTMSLGAWGLTAYGAATSAMSLAQAVEDGVLGRGARRARLARFTRGTGGRALQAVGLPLALFVGSYTGVLLGTTSNPGWARRARLLGPLYAASAMSSGVAAVGLLRAPGAWRDASHAGAVAGARALRRLARAESVALAAELVLALAAWGRVRRLPSARAEGALARLARALTFGAGIALPLVMQTNEAWGREEDEVWRDVLGGRRHRGRGRGAGRGGRGIAASALALAGSLALRFLTVRAGYRSARTPADTWVHTGGSPWRPRASSGTGGALAGRDRGTVARRARGAGEPSAERANRRGVPARASRALRGGEVSGRITIVQEDRIRLLDAMGRGYLLIVRPRRATLAQLERWRDAGTLVRVRYSGEPDVGGLVERVEVVR